MRHWIKTIVIAAALVLIPASFLAARQEETKTAAMLEKAKKLIYEKQWEQAVKAYKELLSSYGDKASDEANYWLAYSLYKYSQNQSKVNDQVRVMQDAVNQVNALLKNYPASSWADDAEALRVDISEELVKSGLSDFKKYIRESAGDEQEDVNPEMEMKLVALNAMLNMDSEKAFPTLEKVVRNGKSPKLREQALFVLSQQSSEKATALLAEIAGKDPEMHVREQAIFWLGQRRDAASFEALLKLYDTINDPDLREKLIFAFSQSPSPKAADKLFEIARNGKDPNAQEKAVFWLGQKNDPRALDALIEIYDKTPDKEVREKLVFALSQQKSERARQKLVAIAKDGSDADSQSKAIFWLGREGTPRRSTSWSSSIRRPRISKPRKTSSSP